MAPEKKAGKGKGGGKKKAGGGSSKKKSKTTKTSARKAVLLDGAPITDLTREQLLVRLERIIIELEREREERLYFQAERDRLYEIWEATKQKCRETECQVLCLEKDVETGNAGYREQIAVQRQRQAFLMHQHQITLTEFQLKSQEAIAEVRAQAGCREKELLEKNEELKEELREQKVKFALDVTEINKAHGEALLAVKEECELAIRDNGASWRQKLESYRAEMEKRYEEELKVIQKQSLKQEAALKKLHEETTAEMMQHNKSQMESHIALIISLKEENRSLKEELCKVENQVNSLRTELSQVRSELESRDDTQAAAKKYKEGFSSAMVSLEKNRIQIRKMKDVVENMQIENEGLNQKLGRCEKERDQLRDQLLRSVLELQQKTSIGRTIKKMANSNNSSTRTSAGTTEDSSY